MSLTGKALERVDSRQEDIPQTRRRMTEEWFESVLPTLEENARPDRIISQLYHCISSFCNLALSRLESHNAKDRGKAFGLLFLTLDNVYDDILDWGDDLKVGNGNLDDALKDSQSLQQLTIKIMVRICDALTNDILPLVIQALKTATPSSVHSKDVETLQNKKKQIELIRDGAIQQVQIQSDSDDSETNSEESASDGLSAEELLESLKNDVELLIDLEPCLEEPIPDFNLKETPALHPEDSEFIKYQPFYDGIKQKYPQCDDSLARSMSKSLYDTTMRLHAERQAAAAPVVTKPDVHGEELPKDSGYGTSIKDPSLGSSDVPEDNMPAGSSYARSLASYAEVDEGDTRIPLPSQPEGLKVGQKFPCIACGRQVAKSERASAWRRHLLSDLRPWVCCQLSCGCAREPYPTRNQWIGHLQAQHQLHPHWDDKTCPFCQQFIKTGREKMINHVERHLWHLFLAALTANPGNDGDDSDSDHDRGDFTEQTQRGTTPGSPPTLPLIKSIDELKDHTLYKDAAQEEDGLWHCPWEGEDYCDHKPSVLRADYDNFLLVHMKSLQCNSCGEIFATQEIRYLHELKEHDMHKGGGRYLCTSPGCGRSRPGNGFASRWVQLEHIKNVHENIPDLPKPTSDN